MNGKHATSIQGLRQRLVQARIEHNLGMLVELEEGLRELATSGYRCCLLDYEHYQASYYVRLLGYEKGRIKVELEYPIEPKVCMVQWLPLSHLADYDEVQSREKIHRIYAGLAPFIHRKTMKLERARQNGQGLMLLPGPDQGKAAEGYSTIQRRLAVKRRWWYVGGFLLLVSLAFFVARHLDRFYLL